MALYRDNPSTLPPDCAFANLRARLQAEGPIPDWVFQQVKLIHARRVLLEQEYRMSAPTSPIPPQPAPKGQRPKATRRTNAVTIT